MGRSFLVIIFSLVLIFFDFTIYPIATLHPLEPLDRCLLLTSILLDLTLYEQRQLERLEHMGQPQKRDGVSLDQWSEQQCGKETRFTKTDLARIKTLLRIPDIMQTYCNDLFTGILFIIGFPVIFKEN